MKKLTLLAMLFLFLNTSFSQQGLDSLKLILPIGHTQSIKNALLSSNGKLLLTNSEDNTVRLYNVLTGKELKILSEPHNSVSSVTYNQKIDLIALINGSYWSKGDEVFLRIYKSPTDINPVIFSGHKAYISCVNFSSDGKYILTSSNDKTSCIIESSSGKELKRFIGHDAEVNSAFFSPDEKSIITAASDSTIRIWDINTGNIRQTFKRQKKDVKYANFSPDAKTILSIEGDTSRIFDVKTGKEVFAFTQVPFYDTTIVEINGSDTTIQVSETRAIGIESKFSNDGKYVSVNNGNAAIYNSVNGKLLYTFVGEHGVFSPNNAIFATAFNTSNWRNPIPICILWDLKTGKKIKEITNLSSYISYLKFSDDGEKLVIGFGNGKIILYNLNSKNKNLMMSSLTPSVNAIKCSIDNQIVTVNGTYWSKGDEVFLRIYKSPTDINPVIFSGHKAYISCVNFSSDGKYILTSSNDKTSCIIESSSGKELKRFIGHDAEVNSAFFSPDEKSIITAASDSTIRIWDINTGNIRQTFKRQKKDVKYANFSPDAKTILSIEGDTSRIFDVKTGKEVFAFTQVPFYDTTIVEINGSDTTIQVSETRVIGIESKFSNDGKYVSVNNGNAAIYNSVNGKLLYTFVGEHGVFSPNNAIFASAFNTSNWRNPIPICIIWDLKTGKKIKEITNLSSYVSKLQFSDDGNFLIIDYLHGNPSLYNFKTTKLINSKVLNNITTGASWNIFPFSTFTNINNNYISCGADYKLIFWSSFNSLPVFERIELRNNNWLIKLANSPYYMCSKDASKMLHYVTPSLKVIGFEQLDPVYNRPDIVLDSIGKYFGGADQELVANYRQSWEKRIDRLGLDKEKLGKGEIAVPNAEIVGADAIAYENNNGKLDIKVAANDPKYPLRRFNVYVNEVPLYGSAGISIAHLKKQVWDTTVSVPLSIGENKIQVSVMNELGLENFKYPSYVNYAPSESIVAKTYFIGIGVNEFKESSHNLKYCVKDVTDLSMSFGGPNTEVKLFTNAQVTKENILALKDYLSKTTVNDKVIISCSSHGLLDDSLNFYLAMQDVDFKNPKARGLKYEELENLLDGIPARQKLLLLDACNSGENDKTELIKRELEQKNSKMDSTQIPAARGVKIKLEDENKSNFKKMNELFVNVRNNTGSVIVSAAGGQESALEAITVDGKSIENGAFSYCVLEYLKNNSNKPEELTVNQLKNYVEKRVEEITNGKQQPTSRQETMEVDWGLR